MFDLTLSSPNTSGPRPYALFSLLSPKNAHLISLMLNRKSSGKEISTTKMQQMSYCKAVKPPLASFRLLLIESCVVIRRLCRETGSWEVPVKIHTFWFYTWFCFLFLYISILHCACVHKHEAYSWSSTYGVSAIIDFSWKTWCILTQILPQSLLLIHCLHALKRILISKPEAPFKMIIDDKEWMIS